MAIAGAAALVWLGALGAHGPVEPAALTLLLAIAGATVLGFIDDVRPLHWGLKLAGQIVCAGIAAGAVPPELPAEWLIGSVWTTRVLATMALVAVMNLVNFVDGIDGITAAHAVPAFAVSASAAAFGVLPFSAGICAAATCGAMIGFWWWNRHPARIFLGDAGSLPIGLLLGWLSLLLAGRGQVAAALLILAYPLADGGSTLLRRLVAGKRLTQPHRDHAYQRAVDSGLRVRQVSRTVLLVSVASGFLAVTALLAGGGWIAAGATVVGIIWVAIPIIGWLRRAGLGLDATTE